MCMILRQRIISAFLRKNETFSPIKSANSAELCLDASGKSA